MTAPTAPGADGRQEVCLACGKPWSAHTPLYDDCPMFIADGALSYNQQLEMMAELNGWMYRANQAEAAVEDARQALSAANARIRELEAQRGGQVSEQDLALAKIAIRGTDKYTVNDIAGRDYYRLSAELLPRFVAALATDSAPACAEQDDQGGTDAA